MEMTGNSRTVIILVSEPVLKGGPPMHNKTLQQYIWNPW